MDPVSFIETFARICMTVGIICTIAILAGYPAAHWIGGQLAALLSCLPTEKFTKAPPALGIPASKAVRGDLAGAIEDYEKLLIVHPAEKEIYFRLVEITLGPLHEEAYGEDVLQRGVKNLKCESERIALLKFAEAIRHGDFTPMRHYDHHPLVAHGQFT